MSSEGSEFRRVDDPETHARMRDVHTRRGADGRPFKLLDDRDEPLRFGNVYRVIREETYACVWAGTDDDQVETLLELAQNLEPPYGLVWVLAVPVEPDEPGRYSKWPDLSFEQVAEFLRVHRDFFECDARHSIWVADAGGRFVVYDRNNFLYGYGPVDAHERTLRARGFVDGEPTLTVPHSHMYYPEYHSAQRAVAGAFEWQVTELKPGDDD